MHKQLSLIPYLQLMRLNKPIGIYLLLWPTLWALWIAAKGIPNLTILFIFILGVIITRSAGCVINDIADRHYDPFVKRTHLRPLATGDISVKNALLLFIFLCSLGLILIYFLNPLTQKLSLIALLLLIIYPFSKRYTYWPQLILGAAFGWAIPMAFAAQTNSIPLNAWLLYSCAILWPLAYDTMYAMVDSDDDKKIGIKSTALLFETYESLFIGIIQTLLIILLVIVGIVEKLNFFYYFSLIVGSFFFIYQYFLLKKRIPEKCFNAFLNNNWFGLVFFLGIMASTHYL
ncbi:MAG: 4-hydroxybenzoate octaprenyltransferase [Legionellaceae bacterium]